MTFSLFAHTTGQVPLYHCALQEEMCGLRDSGVGAGLWEVPFLDEGVALISSLNPYGSIPIHSLQTGQPHCQQVALHLVSRDPGCVPAGQSRPPVSEPPAEVMFSNTLFWSFPELLPRAGPAALSASSVGRTSPFTPAEDK